MGGLVTADAFRVPAPMADADKAHRPVDSVPRDCTVGQVPVLMRTIGLAADG
jgi:hypothetical protein